MCIDGILKDGAVCWYLYVVIADIDIDIADIVDGKVVLMFVDITEIAVYYYC